MRVLCSTTPMDGVLGPFLPLGRALVEADHEVIVATGANLRGRVEENNLGFIEVGLPAMEGMIGAMADPEVKAAEPGDRIRFPAAMFGWVHPNAKLSALRELAHARPLDLIVHPPVDVSGPLLAAELRLPSVCYGFAQPFDPAVLAAMAARVRPLWERARLDPEPSGGIYRGMYLDPRPPRLRGDNVETAAPDMRAIRPELPGDAQAALPEWAGRLGERPVVYISLGTAPLFNQPEKFAPLLAGVAQEDVDVVVTVGELNDPAALGERPMNVHVERWLPLAPLLPRCDAVLCHAGTGTMLAALAAGLPLVLVPQGADQFDNARACARAGAARVLMPAEVSPEAVREAVRTVLAPDSTERAAALTVAAEIEAMPSAAEIVEELETLVQRHPQCIA
jgi:UDP:flavonoid glycosyltransferase YjiC (YdhE family)